MLIKAPLLSKLKHIQYIAKDSCLDSLINDLSILSTIRYLLHPSGKYASALMFGIWLHTHAVKLSLAYNLNNWPINYLMEKMCC